MTSGMVNEWPKSDVKMTCVCYLGDQVSFISCNYIASRKNIYTW